ncbi:MAG: hypothetical protein RL260_3309 [Pseudomonadota bacterium]
MRLTDPAATALWARLQAFELDPPGLTRTVSDRIAEDNRWTATHTRRAVEEYRRFLLLTQVAGRPVSPSAAVDVVWHTHLLYSRDYWGRLCGEVLGVPLHHDPNPGGVLENIRHGDQYRDTLDDYARVFGEAPPADLWPSASAVPVPKLETLGDHGDVLARLLAGGYRPSLLAFLCGGEERVTATALAGLHQRGLVGFVKRKPVLGDRAPRDDEGLTPEEWAVWRELRRLTDASVKPKLPLTLSYPALVREAAEDALWPTPAAQEHTAAVRRAGVWRSFPRWLAVPGGVSLLYRGHGLLGALVLLGVLYSLYRAYAHTPIRPTRRGQRLVEEFTRLVPRGTSVTLGSPLLASVVAAGVIGAATAGDLALLKSAIAPRSGDGGGCGGGGCGGGCGGGG